MINFIKMHGLGNDFVLINLLTEPWIDYQMVAKKWCNRRVGIGADGLILITQAEDEKNHLRMTIYNSDGSEADMCGNGLRCFAKYVFEERLVLNSEFRVETKAGVMIPTVILHDHKVKDIRVNMGKPNFLPSKIPILLENKEVIDQEVRIGDTIFRINAVSMGNPHCVIYVKNLDNFPIERVGPIIERDQIFPARTNVEFVEVINRKQLNMRVWERGAGITLACGTGACAAVVASVKNDLTDSQVTVQLPGGELFIEWAADELVYMTGPAEYVFSGKIDSKLDERE